ncbi:MAG TPA: hypothetical protein DIT04_11330 [Dysgonomonas sp.]|nr:hypothetical protein [Dysgonomonas sp.]
MRLVWKLLKENISKPQLIGFFFANLIGMCIILLAIQFYSDMNPLLTGKDNLFKEDYFTITKKVGMLSGLTSRNTGFSPQEIEDLKEQDFIQDVGIYTPSQFNVFTGFNSQDAGVVFSTEMFFESVPDKFIDVRSDEWNFSPTDNTIPIILPKNYLDLYNFGFAEASSMPKISEGLAGMVNLDVTIYAKNGQRREFRGRIVAFTNRINTILVPESFMLWANQKFGNADISFKPARLIVEVGNIVDPTLVTYFKDKGYEISGENTNASRMSFFLKVIVSIVALVGVIICILSFFVLVLSIYLLLEKNMNKLRTLRLIGYTRSFVSRPYILLSVGLNAIILVFSVVVVFIGRSVYMDAVKNIYSVGELKFPVITLVTGILVFAILSVLNIFIIKTKIK